MWAIKEGGKLGELEEQVEELLRLAEEAAEEGLSYTARARAREAMELAKKADATYRTRVYDRSRAIIARVEKERYAGADDVSFSELEEDVRATYPLGHYENRRVNAWWQD